MQILNQLRIHFLILGSKKSETQSGNVDAKKMN